MNRSSEIVVVSLVVIAVLAALYAGGYWLWVKPLRGMVGDDTCPPTRDGGQVAYFPDNTVTGHAFAILYTPVFYFEGAEVVYDDATP